MIFAVDDAIDNGRTPRPAAVATAWRQRLLLGGLEALSAVLSAKGAGTQVGPDA